MEWWAEDVGEEISISEPITPVLYPHSINRRLHA